MLLSKLKLMAFLISVSLQRREILNRPQLLAKLLNHIRVYVYI